MDFGLGGGGGGGGGGAAQTSAQLKCVWARNVFGRQRKIILFLLCYGVTFSGA